jgi:hypothetical protein
MALFEILGSLRIEVIFFWRDRAPNRRLSRPQPQVIKLPKATLKAKIKMMLFLAIAV